MAMLAMAIMAVAGTYSVSTLPNMQLKDHTKLVVNPDGILSPEVEAQMDTLLLDARRRTSAEIVAVAVDDIDTDDLDSFATSLFNTWGIGKKDNNNGILLIMVKDKREVKIRTGYGAEGIMPDILAGRIIRNEIIPRFRNEDYGGGMLAAVKEIHRMVTDPDAAAEIMSQERDNYDTGVDPRDLLNVYLRVSAFAAVALLLGLALLLLQLRKCGKSLSDYQKYQILSKYQLAFWVVTLIFIGIPILAPLILWLLKDYYRNHRRKCPRCSHQMRKISEEEDNQYLNYAQDLEEKIKSVDYDVWKCPNCGEKDIYSFINKASQYHECPVCHARTEKLTGTRIISEPTYRRRGVGEKRYVCLHCNNQRGERYTIPKKEKPVVVVGPGGGSGIGGGGFGGGSFGGGFGGGLTGGGGAGGRW